MKATKTTPSKTAVTADFNILRTPVGFGTGRATIGPIVPLLKVLARHHVLSRHVGLMNLGAVASTLRPSMLDRMKEHHIDVNIIRLRYETFTGLGALVGLVDFKRIDVFGIDHILLGLLRILHHIYILS